TNYAAPTVAVAGADQENCNVSSFTLAGNAPVVGTGLWSIVSGTGVITNPTIYNTTVTGVAAGSSVTLRWTVSNGSCAGSSDEVVLTNYAAPTVPVTTNQYTYVGATGIVYDATAATGHTLVWYSDGSGSSIITKPIVSTAIQGTFTAYVAQQNDATGCISRIISVIVNVNPVGIKVTKTVDKDNITTPTTLTYNITVENTGDFDLENIAVTDVLKQSGAADINITSIGSPVQTGGAPTGNNNTILEIGEKWTYTFTYNVSQSQIDKATSLINNVSVTSTQIPTASNDVAITTITTTPGIRLVKTHNKQPANGENCSSLTVGEVVTYTFVVHNTGSVT
ncbi:DUF7507 domain-containing protein, partial [Sphingobacterium faecale]